MKTRLRVLRAEMEWSQADLAERLGVSRQTINAIETGKCESSLPLAIRIARLFGKAVEEVFLLDVGPPRNSPSERDPCRRYGVTRPCKARISPVLPVPTEGVDRKAEHLARQ